MPTVKFAHAKDMTQEDLEIIVAEEEKTLAGFADRLLEAVRALDGSTAGFQVTRYQHSLQSATRAYRNGESEEFIVAALLHDIGDELAPVNHGELVATILKPYVSEKICWVLKYHPLFLSYYYAHLIGGDRYARDRYKDSPHYADTVKFCAQYDQCCFDPTYEPLPLDFFEPMLRRVVAEPRYLKE